MVPGFVRHARSKQITAVEAERFTPKGEVGRYKFPPMVMAKSRHAVGSRRNRLNDQPIEHQVSDRSCAQAIRPGQDAEDGT